MNANLKAEDSSPLRIYRASAGSGKTRVLLQAYLELALTKPEAYRHILAMTFTNKATAELKAKLIRYLFEISRRQDPAGLASDLSNRFPELNLPQAASSLLTSLLHDYSHLAVFTLEKFFYGIVRAFGWELGLNLGPDLELETDRVLSYLHTTLLQEAATDTKLSEWLIDFVQEKMAEGNSWNIRREINTLAKILLDESLPELQYEEMTLARVRAFKEELKQRDREFTKELRVKFGAVKTILDRYGLTSADLFYSKAGVGGFIDKILKGEVIAPSQRATLAYEGYDHWFAQKGAKQGIIIQALEAGLYTAYKDAYLFLLDGITSHTTLKFALKLLPIYPLLGRLQTYLARYRNEYGTLLISDVGALLAQITAGSSTPFIYEKISNRYRHYLLDEFQDTSTRQWQNLLPLVQEALDRGHDALIVGDAKQSIYRWRGGKMHLLEGLEKQMAAYSPQAEQSTTNYRSGENIVAFNNMLFPAAGERVSQYLLSKGVTELSALAAYNPKRVVQQHADEHATLGYVYLSFLPRTANEPVENDDSLLTGWKETAKARTLKLLDKLKEEGYAPGDITLLVRDNRQAALLAEFLTANHYAVQSADSLLAVGSAQVQLLLSALEYLAEGDLKKRTESVAAAHLKYAQAQRIGASSPQTALFEPTATAEVVLLKEKGKDWLQPLETYRDLLLQLAIPVQVEYLIELLQLSAPEAEMARFQEAVQDYATKGQDIGSPSLMGFLRWWAENGRKYKIPGRQGTGSVNILTLHKAKGLQFPVVILPFADWPMAPNAKTLLWAQANEAPYTTFPALPMRATQGLKDTYFAEAYWQEYAQNYIDELNLLYVGFTRPEQRLYVFSVLPGESPAEHLTVSQLLYDVLTANAKELADEGTTKVYRMGTLSAQIAKQLTETAIFEAYHTSTTWYSKLAVRRRAAELQDLLSPNESGRRRGKLIHLVLARILTHADLEPTLRSMIAAAELGEAEANELTATLLSILAMPEVAHWFSGSLQVLREQEIVLPTGKVARPDRVMLGPEINGTRPATVVDYKTGALPVDPMNEDRHQVHKYADALSSLGYVPVSAYLLYLEGPHQIGV